MHDGVKAMKFLRNFFRSKAAVFAVSILALILAIVISLCVGVVMYSPAELLKMPDILRYIRFPRVMAAVFAGAGLAYGYDLILGRHWNLEFEIGAGYAYTRYDQFECQECGSVLAEDMTHHYIGITKAAISLVFIF